MTRRYILRTGKFLSKASPSLEIWSPSRTASLRPDPLKYEGKPDHPEEVARVTPPRLALRHARAATRGDRDFRKESADGVRRKEEGGHEDGEGGEVERVGDVADMSSTETSDSELGSEVVMGSERSREGAHS